MSELLIKLWQNGILQLGIWETVYMTLISTFFAYLIGLPVGLILRMTDRDGIHPIGWLNRTLGIIVNALRSIPFIILMVAMLPVAKFVVGTSLGNRAVIVTLVIAAAPYVARMVESAAKEVNAGVIEAAQSMGASTFRIIWKVIIPEAKPALITGAVISTVTILGYSAMAGTIGGGGLGQIAITYGYQKYDDQIVWLCVALTILIVQILQEFGMYIARRTDRLEALAAELTAKHSTFCRILPADLEQESECARLCEALTDERIDIFINNAGFGVCGSFLETSGEKELSMAKVNVLAMHQLFKFAVKKMEAQGFGTVLNVASSAGLLPGGPYMAGYYATKAYVVSLTRGVAEELREQHSPVYVCALCPGPVDTEFNDRADVVFALRGIRPEFCVEEAMRGMLRRKTIIVPSALMQAATAAQRLVPMPLLMPIVARQQKKKLG